MKKKNNDDSNIKSRYDNGILLFKNFFLNLLILKYNILCLKIRGEIKKMIVVIGLLVLIAIIVLITLAFTGIISWLAVILSIISFYMIIGEIVAVYTICNSVKIAMKDYKKKSDKKIIYGTIKESILAIILFPFIWLPFILGVGSY